MAKSSGNPYPMGHRLWELAERLVDAGSSFRIAEAGLTDALRACEPAWIAAETRRRRNARRAVLRAYDRLEGARHVG